MEKIIIELIKMGYSYSDILLKTSITSSQLLRNLYLILEKNNLSFDMVEKIKSLIYQNACFKKYDRSNDVLLVSDLHWGNFEENRKYMDLVYNYAAKHKITDIYILGDLMDGNLKCSLESCDSYEKQLEHFVSNYPYDKNIHNYALLGNHDYLLEKNVNVEQKLSSAREDFTVMGYKNAYIKIYYDYINLKHKVMNYKTINNIYEPTFIFLGHSHNYKCSNQLPGQCTKIYLPHLFTKNNSSIFYNEAGFVHLEFYYSHKKEVEYVFGLYGFDDLKIKFIEEKYYRGRKLE